MGGQVIKKLLLLLILVACAIGQEKCAHAATITVNPGQSQATIQGLINGASSGDTVIFSAGTYTLGSSGFTGKCGITYTGPVATPATAIIRSNTVTIRLLNFFGGCSSSTTTTIEYLRFDNAGGIYLDANNYWNINILHDQFTSIPYTNDSCGTCAGMQFDGNIHNTDTNITVEYNSIGDVNSCNANSGMTVDSGACVGLIVSQANPVNMIVKYNTIFHLQEGIHYTPSNYVVGNPTAQCDGCDIEFNYLNGIHRNAIEFQTNTINHAEIISNNVLGPPTNGYFGTLSFTIPCCQYSNTFGNPSNVFPSGYLTNNLLYSNVSAPNSSPLAYEVEGAGTQVLNNLIQGSFCTGVTWSYVSTPWQISFNTMTGPTMASGVTCPSSSGGGNGSFISPEGGHGSPPTTTGNVTGSTPSAVTSVAPSISPASGAYASPITVTLADPGYTTGPQPLGNTSIWYTTDGSTPVPGSGTAQLYTLPITVSLPATVKAVGMWGTPPQPTSYPSGYGFTPSAVQSRSYVASGGVTLSSATIAPTGGVSTLNIGSTVQMIVTCHYSDGTTTGCNTTDSHGSAVSAWMSTNGNVSVSSSGLATGAAIGSSVITATVSGLTTSPGSTLTVNASALTLSSVTTATTGGVSSITSGATNQLITSCHYSDGTSTTCNTMDSHGNAASSYNSTAPTVATVTSGGLVTGVAGGSTSLTATVNPSPSMLGTSLQNVTGFTNNGFINEIYGVTGTSPGSYTPGNCHIIIPATTNWTAGKLWTCLLVIGTPTTQNASALCSNSYTMTGTSWPGGDVIISMASCPALPPDQGYWVGSTTNQTTANPDQGFSNCNSSCSGAAPVSGSGTYAYRYVANTFGNYTSLPTTLNASGGTRQVSQYIELTTTPVTSANLPLTVTTPPPSLVSAYLTASSNSMIVGNTMQMAAKCHYTSGPDQDCTVADIYGDAVSAWASSDPTKATIGAVGSANPGLVTAVAAGTPSMSAVINTGGITSTAYPITVANPSVSLTGVSLSTAGGVTGLFVGATNQLKATCTYSDGSSDDCTTTDAHGNLAHSFVSTAPAHATVNATTGLVTGVAPGSTTFTVVAGSFTSNPLPLAVFPVLSGIYTIILNGPVKFSGTVRF